MKKLNIISTTLTVLFICICSVTSFANETEEALIEDIRMASVTFEKAIDQRNFKVAKEQLQVLYPLMKKEFKLAKKQISSLEKEGLSSDALFLEKSLDRKKEIHDLLHNLAEASSASLRVQAADAKSLVKEYIDILDEKQELLSSLN